MEKLKSWDSQSRQGFVLLEQQLWNLSEAVLVEAPEWTNGHWEALTEKTQTGKCVGAGLSFSQSLQLLQLIERSSLHGADLVLHQVTEKTGTAAKRSAGDQFRLPESMVWIWLGNLLCYFLLGGTLGSQINPPSGKFDWHQHPTSGSGVTAEWRITLLPPVRHTNTDQIPTFQTRNQQRHLGMNLWGQLRWKGVSVKELLSYTTCTVSTDDWTIVSFSLSDKLANKISAML